MSILMRHLVRVLGDQRRPLFEPAGIGRPGPAVPQCMGQAEPVGAA